MRFGGSLLGGALFALAASAHADPVPSLDLRNFHPPTDPQGFLYLEPARTPGPGNWNVGVAASYALSPISLDDANGDHIAHVIEHQASLDYFANIGVGKTWAFSVAIPTVVYQTGDDVNGLLPGSSALPHAAIGMPSLGVKKVLVSPSDLGGLGISAVGRFDIPTSSHTYVSDRTVGGEVRVLGELDLLAIAVRATAGFHLRGDQEVFLRDGTDTYAFQNDIPWGAGVTLRPQTLGIDRGGHWRFTAEARGAIGTTPKFAGGPQSPALVGLSARYTAGDVSAIFGAELPLNDAVGNPLVRPVVAVGWAPRVEDADNDGIPDDKDDCPELAEDKDGFEDQDGCPDFDNDDDGVNDEDDKCPKEKEDTDEFQDEDGCPDPDNDGDGVLDTQDKCPNEKGPTTGPHAGCPDPDPDHDGIEKDKDKCPNAPEDKDGFRDDDGCPDPDNDGDRVLDAADACPLVRGEPSPVPEFNGCVLLDHDGDTFDDKVDKCPKAPEDFDGVDDEDGCPDAKPGKTPPKPLITIEDAHDVKYVKWRAAPRFVKDDVDPKSLATLRAVASVLNAHPNWIVAVGARPAGATAVAEQTALNHAFAVVLSLRWLTHRDEAAETVGWGAVHDLPGAQQSGLGILVLTPLPAAPEPSPSVPKP